MRGSHWLNSKIDPLNMRVDRITMLRSSSQSLYLKGENGRKLLVKKKLSWPKLEIPNAEVRLNIICSAFTSVAFEA